MWSKSNGVLARVLHAFAALTCVGHVRVKVGTAVHTRRPMNSASRSVETTEVATKLSHSWGPALVMEATLLVQPSHSHGCPAAPGSRHQLPRRPSGEVSYSLSNEPHLAACPNSVCQVPGSRHAYGRSACP